MSNGTFALLLLLHTALVVFGIIQLYRGNREDEEDDDEPEK